MPCSAPTCALWPRARCVITRAATAAVSDDDDDDDDDAIDNNIVNDALRASIHD